MPIVNAEDLFFGMLSNLRNSEQRLAQVCQEWSQLSQHKQVKELLETRAYLQQQDVNNIDECFRVLGRQPMQPATRLHEAIVDEFRKELNEIQSPALKALYTIGAIRRIQNFHIAEYVTLVEMAKLMENIKVAALLERNLADKLVFIERTRELVREVGRTAIAARLEERVAGT